MSGLKSVTSPPGCTGMCGVYLARRHTRSWLRLGGSVLRSSPLIRDCALPWECASAAPHTSRMWLSTVVVAVSITRSVYAARSRSSKTQSTSRYPRMASYNAAPTCSTVCWVRVALSSAMCSVVIPAHACSTAAIPARRSSSSACCSCSAVSSISRWCSSRRLYFSSMFLASCAISLAPTACVSKRCAIALTERHSAKQLSKRQNSWYRLSACSVVMSGDRARAGSPSRTVRRTSASLADRRNTWL
mmetsp:Transcript_33367/g.87523  ORF Transcript_33367/g.87523 Transcript_33367/m.87523 type:complete len:246 (+) Transcript_33367:690-1427(+)